MVLVHEFQTMILHRYPANTACIWIVEDPDFTESISNFPPTWPIPWRELAHPTGNKETGD